MIYHKGKRGSNQFSLDFTHHRSFFRITELIRNFRSTYLNYLLYKKPTKSNPIKLAMIKLEYGYSKDYARKKEKETGLPFRDYFINTLLTPLDFHFTPKNLMNYIADELILTRDDVISIDKSYEARFRIRKVYVKIIYGT